VAFINGTIVMGLTEAYNSVHECHYRSFKINIYKKSNKKKLIQKGPIVAFINATIDP